MQYSETKSPWKKISILKEIKLNSIKIKIKKLNESMQN